MIIIIIIITKQSFISNLIGHTNYGSLEECKDLRKMFSKQCCNTFAEKYPAFTRALILSTKLFYIFFKESMLTKI